MLIIFETAGYFGRIILDKTDIGWLYKNPNNILEEHPCVVMKTHPIFSHVPDHRNKCNIRGGYALETYVFYGDKKSINYPAIVTLGGSTTSGFYQHYANGFTYPYWLSKLLKDYKIQVINGGHGGYSSSEELLKLLLEVRAFKYQTPIILSLNGINDLILQSENNPFIPHRVQQMYAMQEWINQGFLPNFFPNIWSFIKYFSPQIESQVYDSKIKPDHAIFKQVDPVEIWEKNIKAMYSISKSEGLEYFTFLQPTMGLDGPQSKLPADQKSNDFIMLQELLEGKIEEGYESWYLKLLNDKYKKMKIICSNLDFCHDISDIASPKGNFYSNPRHHNENGNKIIAMAILSILKQESIYFN